MVESFDLATALEMWMNDAEGDIGDRHEIWQRLRQEIETMRATGLTPPGDLVEMEESLAAEFTAEAEGQGENESDEAAPSTT